MRETNRSASGYPIRELVPEDFHRWLALVQAVEMDQSGAVQTNEERLRRQLKWPRTQRWVIEAPGDSDTLIASGMLFAQIKERSALDLLVHPSWRRQGVGRLMLNHLMEESHKIGADYANYEILDTSSAGIALLKEADFEAFSHAWILRAPAEVEFPAPAWPEGYEARSYAAVNNVDVVVEAMNRGYGDLWGHHENTAGGITAEDAQRSLQMFDPQAVFIAFAPDGSPAGLTRVERVEQLGIAEDLLDGPGIASEHRALQLHTPLTLHALSWLRSKGRNPVRLESWGDSAETIAQYEALGFQLIEHYIAFRKDLRKA